MGDGNDGAAAQAQVAGEPQETGGQAAVTAGLQGESESESTPIPFTPLRCPRGGILRVPPLELIGAEVSQRRVGPRPVAEALDALEDLERRLIARLERAGVHALGLDDAHGRLHRRVAPGRRYRARRRLDPGLAHGLPEQQRGVPRPVVAVMDAALGRVLIKSI